MGQCAQNFCKPTFILERTCGMPQGDLRYTYVGSEVGSVSTFRKVPQRKQRKVAEL